MQVLWFLLQGNTGGKTSTLVETFLALTQGDQDQINVLEMERKYARNSIDFHLFIFLLNTVLGILVDIDYPKGKMISRLHEWSVVSWFHSHCSTDRETNASTAQRQSRQSVRPVVKLKWKTISSHVITSNITQTKPITTSPEQVISHQVRQTFSNGLPIN